jgi:23S rRNA (uracil1939-C5)-methyltransferase
MSSSSTSGSVSATKFRRRQQVIGTVLDVEIESVNAAGDGVAHVSGRLIVIPFTIPGERVRVRPASRQDGTRADVEAILRPSPHRVTPRCAHFGPDAEPGIGPRGGCAWQHIAYPEQLRLKTELVTRLVRAAVPDAPAARAMLPGVASGDPWGYRQKVHFVFAPESRGGGLVMGHYARGSRRVIPVTECPVHDERGNAMAFRLRDQYVRARAAAAPAGALKSIAIRVGSRSSELMGTLVVTHDGDRTVRAATRGVLDGPGAPSSFHVNVHPKANALIFGGTTRRVSGAGRLREDVAGTSFLISPTAFFQTNVHAAEILVRLVLDSIPAGACVLDLYAGAGLFALPLAHKGHELVAVEENRAAVADGEESRRLNGVPDRQCRFMARRVEDALESAVARTPFDAVILDPPRDGCPASVIARVFGGIAPRLAAYISCDPEALARDLGAISRLGYRIQSIQPVDMFPHTPHVESVVVLTR